MQISNEAVYELPGMQSFLQARIETEIENLVQAEVDTELAGLEEEEETWMEEMGGWLYKQEKTFVNKLVQIVNKYRGKRKATLQIY